MLYKMYLRNYGNKVTPQSEPIPNTVKNSAGGYSFELDKWKKLDRFLILGTEGGSYYVSERKLTTNNVDSVKSCIKENGVKVVKMVVEISESARAPKNDPALFVLALCASEGNPETRKLAFTELPKVARIGTHLFHFVEYVNDLRGWGRGLRSAIGNWYNSKDSDNLGFLVTKYQSRDKWANADLLRLSHPKPIDEIHGNIYKWIVDKEVKDPVPDIINGFVAAQQDDVTEKDIVRIIRDYKLTTEMIPTKFLTSAKVWETLLPNLGLTAIIRNLGNMSKSGLLVPGNWTTTNFITMKLNDPVAIKKSKVHPIGILTALLTYNSGHGFRGKGEWDVVQQVVDALDSAFYISFGNVEPTNKRLIYAIDISGSMESGSVAGVNGLTPRISSCALAMIGYKTEKNIILLGFHNSLIPLEISKFSRLDAVVKYVDRLGYGGTDCALPMIWANKKNIDVDGFVVYTDSETWCGDIHPKQALDQYRRKTGIKSKSVVVGMVSNDFSIADPEDPGMLDVVGFDIATPNLINQFITD